MKLICSQSDLNTHLSLVSRAVPSRPTHPILSNILMVADSETQRVSVTAFDLSLGIRSSFPAQIEVGGDVTLPAKLLTDIVSRLNEGEITLVYDDEETEGDSATVMITSASGRFQVRGMDAEEFPELPVIEDGKSLMLPVFAVNEGLKGALFAASTDETKQVLTGVHLKHSQENLEFAATDGHRLAVVEVVDNPVSEDEDEEENNISSSLADMEDFEVTIPARALKELEKMINSAEESDLISLCFDEGQVIFELGDQRLNSRKLDGAYPAYHQLIPKQFNRQMSLERKRLINSIERVAVLADQKNNIVRFSLNNTEQSLGLSVETREVGSGKEAMAAQISGDDLEIAFNIKYLLDGLKALPTNEISMHLNDSNQPVIITPLGGVKMTYLIMPVQIRD
jgi:DNA polymerase III subunit beta